MNMQHLGSVLLKLYEKWLFLVLKLMTRYDIKSYLSRLDIVQELINANNISYMQKWNCSNVKILPGIESCSPWSRFFLS